jgi:hypothetical protein
MKRNVVKIMQNRIEKVELPVPVCIMCDLPKQQGIHILTQYICEECETEIVHTDVSQEKYLFFVSRLKQYLVVENI